MSVKAIVVIDGDVTCRLMFTRKRRKIDIRRKYNGRYSKDGVCLSDTEFRFCQTYIDNYEVVPAKIDFFRTIIEKEPESSVKITKKGNSVSFPISFWKHLDRFEQAVNYLLTESPLPKMALLDLDLATQQLPEETVLACDWMNWKITKGSDSILLALGLLEPEEVENREFDPNSLQKLFQPSKDRFFSLVRLLYAYKRDK